MSLQAPRSCFTVQPWAIVSRAFGPDLATEKKTGRRYDDCETNQELQVRMYGTQIHANTFDSPRPF